MDFINKLIKKGTFCLILVFGFFVFATGMNVEAAADDCQISLNDGDKYLVLSTTSNWQDSGVNATCGGTQNNNITVKINETSPFETSDSAVDAINSYITKSGFYTIEYSITGESDRVYGKTFVTRQIRVLPTNLNDTKNIWLGESNLATTTADDAFNKIIEIDGGYLAVGHSGSVGFVVKFDVRGEYKWSWNTSEHSQWSSASVQIMDIVKSPYLEDDVYYISGAADSIGFIKPIKVTSDVGVNDEYGNVSLFNNETTQINKMQIYGNYIYGVGYITGADNNNTGIIVRSLLDVTTGQLVGVHSKHVHSQNSEYTSVTSDTTGNIIVVGNQNISSYKGAIGGAVTVCTSTEEFSCETKEPQLYKDENLGNTTITRFNDITTTTNGFMIVGESRAAKLEGSSISYNSGAEDLLFVYARFSAVGKFEIIDVQLRGSTAKDSLYSVKYLEDNKYLAVGNTSSSAYYGFITIDGLQIKIEDNFVSGNSYTVFKDVFVNKSTTNASEIQYAFVGETKSTILEGIIVGNKGNEDAILVILDDTKFGNYSDINILKNSSICEDGVSVECEGSNVTKDYWLVYGENKHNFIAKVSTQTVKTINTIHEFTNSQGIKFKIGRIINITESPVPSDIILNEIGIDKWYLYSRNQSVGTAPSGYEREKLWDRYFYPVEDGLSKTANQYYKLDYNKFLIDSEAGTTEENYKLLSAGYKMVEDGLPKAANQYYKFDGINYILDEEVGTTLNNYTIASLETQNTNVAFQSIEKAREYAVLQEFTRIAMVNEKYDYSSSGIEWFPGENADLAGQNFYFVYYIDLKFSDGSCGTKNLQLTGDCSSYLGYAFADLERIKEISNLVLEANNYFVSERNDRFNFSTKDPVTEHFKEELSTIPYLKTIEFNVPNALYLDVEWYELNKVDQTFSTTPVSLTNDVKTKSKVSFSDIGEITKEGKFVVRYCYSAETCGEASTFVIDRQAPIINYEADMGDKTKNGTLQYERYTKTEWYKMEGDAIIKSIDDIDPYAYTVVNGRKYYLQCNETINSKSCIANLEEFIYRHFNYDPEDPDKIHDIAVYDRANNKTIVYFKIATSSPVMTINKLTDDEGFSFSLNFYKKNALESIAINYTAASDSDGINNVEQIEEGIFQIVNDYYEYNNYLLEKEEEEGFKESIDIQFSLKEGVVLPTLTFDEEKEEYIFGESEPIQIAKGLYKFTIADVFGLITTKTIGIGIDKAELNIYINDDKWYKDFDIENGDYKLPKTSEEFNTELENDSVFRVKEPNTYAQYKEIIQTETLKNSIREDMYFTNQFVFAKIKENNFGITEIKKANTVNYVGVATAQQCLAVIYGSDIDVDSLNQDCVKKIQLSALTNTVELNYDLGIYVLGKDGNIDDGYYYYMAFSFEGIYSVLNKVDSKASGGSVVEDIEKTFVIDYTKPTITPKDYMDVDGSGICNGVVCFENEDFFFTETDTNKIIPNVGNHNVTIDLTTEVFTGVVSPTTNRLLLININGEVYNAYDYSKTVQNIDGGETITFVDSGHYEIVFIDASLNETTIKFIIDKESPTVGEFKDIDPNKDVTKYQQFVEIKINVTENSFLKDKLGESMLTVNYWFDIEPTLVTQAQKNQIYVQNNNGECIVVGNVTNEVCALDGSGLSLSFQLAINKEERKTKTTRLYVEAYDYFKNGYGVNTFQDFDFDNAAPYIYFDSSKYTPTTNFGADEGNDEREKWLSIASDDSLGNFSCDTTNLAKDITICKDTPEIPGKNNNVTIQAYEAYKSAKSNFYFEGGKYYPLEEDSYVIPQTVLYTAQYHKFESKAELDSTSKYVFYHVEYFKVTTNDKINPNKTYYYGDSKEIVNISDLYSNNSYYASCDNTEGDCKLYNMYMTGEGKFTDTEFYYKDPDKFVWMKDKIGVDSNNYQNYYYAINGSYEVDEELNDHYLPAETVEGQKVEYNSTYLDVPAGRIKLFDDSVKYYISIALASGTESSYYISLIESGATKYYAKDERIWKIATDEEDKEIPFGFGVSSVLGRPIIFRAEDGSSNISPNHLETIILVKDSVNPTIKEVSSIVYTKDNANGNYELVTKYYKVNKINSAECPLTTTTYYTDINGTTPINCEDMVEGIDYYAGVQEYVYVATENKVAGKDYYTLTKTIIHNEETNSTNYLTKDNLTVTFSEPIYKIVCTYYDNSDGKTKLCDFSNVEYEYREKRVTFDLIHSGEKLYVNYTLTVYDFSNNETQINYFFIDREAPIIEFIDKPLDADESEDIIEVEYRESESKNTDYTTEYIDRGYENDVIATDSLNQRLKDLKLTEIISNNLTYEVKYYSFNYGVTYKNYTRSGTTFTSVPDHEPKDENIKYYIRIKQPTDYVLKDMTKECSEGYCYVLDEYNYYPNLAYNDEDSLNAKHWTLIDDEKIIKNKVGVYKVVYTATDYSGNVSEELVRTIYVVDRTMPILEVNGKQPTKSTGEHNEAEISILSEGEAKLIYYSCDGGKQDCQMPAHMFEEAASGTSRTEWNSLKATYSSVGMFIVFAYDKGNYISSEVSHEGQFFDVKTLKYNYIQYQFIIDLTAPIMTIRADKDVDNNYLYYEVEVDEDAKLNCVRGSVRGELNWPDGIANNLNNCTDTEVLGSKGSPEAEVKQDGETTYISHNYKNNEGKLIYSITYKKLKADEVKYFYNDYYKYEGRAFIRYDNTKYDNENVYLIVYKKLIFREDGRYLIQAADDAGNSTGRYKSSAPREEEKYDVNYSVIDIDNTAPQYNKLQNSPTGVNYWFSIPSKIIASSDVTMMNSITKEQNGINYNIATSGLNSSFFYAFASETEAITYLTTMYINDTEENGYACADGNGEGFGYAYYDYTQKKMIEKCYKANLGTGDTAKEVAQKAVMAAIKSLVFRTFGGEYLFGDKYIQQRTVTNGVVNSMYKTVYLVTSGGTTTISEQCPSAATSCIKVNVKVINAANVATLKYEIVEISGEKHVRDYDTKLAVGKIEGDALTINETVYTIKNNIIKNSAGETVGSLEGNEINIGGVFALEIGGINAFDTDIINYYKYNMTSKDSDSGLLYTKPLVLEKNTYYIFQETDKAITYTNYEVDPATTIESSNTEYYAIFVDSNSIYDVAYESKANGSSEVVSGTITATTVKTNALEYKVIIKYIPQYDNHGVLVYTYADFIRDYEITEIWDGENLIQAYSYLRLTIDKEDNYVNLNDYYVREDPNSNEYWFEIPVAMEHLTSLTFYDRAGNAKIIKISRTQIAPSISVEYSGSGQDLTVEVAIQDTILASTETDTVEVYFSENGENYEKTDTENILKSLICIPGLTSNASLIYGCNNETGAGGISRYSVIISNKENLYGFFKVVLTDDHGNSNYIEFVYNPMDLNAEIETVWKDSQTGKYKSGEIKYIMPSQGNSRMMSKNDLAVTWNNEWNYITLYKIVGGERQLICSTKSLTAGNTENGNCGNGIIIASFDEGKYLHSTLYYEEEGTYEADITNRASEVINEACNKDNAAMKCGEKIIIVNPNGAEVLTGAVTKEYSLNYYSKFEIDKTVPGYEEVTIETPTGTEIFNDGGSYVNAKVTVKWNEDLVRIHYSCVYDEPGVEASGCQGNNGGFNEPKRQHIFEITNKISTIYTFWLEDYAGNLSEKKSFKIEIRLPDIEVYKVNSNGELIGEILNNDKVNTDVKLICYSNDNNHTVKDCAQFYDVKLYKAVPNGYELVTNKSDNTFISEKNENKYKYVVSIKSSENNIVYEHLNTEIVFTIDKVAPSITIDGEKHEKWGIYKGEVKVLIDTDGVGTIYGDCVPTGVDEYGDKIYDCDDNNPLVEEFKFNYTLSETGVYKIIAVDDIGNVTTGRLIKYVEIDNEKPTISIKASNEYMEYSLAENAYTNAPTIKVTSIDNNSQSYIMYRVKKGDSVYGEWIAHSSSELIVTDEGMYEIKPVDLIGNEGIARHFIIYRQLPQYSVFVGNSVSADTSHQIITENVRVSWSEPEHETQAPIVKVTVNGRAYERQSVISETGEYVFVFTDLAGNTTTHKLTINKDPNVCLNNVKILPNKQYLFNVNNMKLSGGGDYTFKENDVIIFAVPTNYYNGVSACGENILCYKTLDEESYLVLTKAVANYINNNKNVSINISEETEAKINELGGFVYAFVVDYEVATDDLGFKIGENFFTKDPLGWMLIFASGAGLIYIGLKIFVFRKKVKVLK